MLMFSLDKSNVPSTASPPEIVPVLPQSSTETVPRLTPFLPMVKLKL